LELKKTGVACQLPECRAGACNSYAHHRQEAAATEAAKELEERGVVSGVKQAARDQVHSCMMMGLAVVAAMALLLHSSLAL